MSIVTIDCEYVHPKFAAAFLMKEGSEALFVENNTAHSVPLLLAELRRQGLTPEQVKYLIITHVHLDHAGGSQALMEACPNAILLAHPRAAPHMIDPSKLVSSARQVYGDEPFRKMYGEIGPIPASRVRAMEDGEEIAFGGRRLRFLHTRGHANHHFIVHDSGENAVFTGDSFGLAYPALQGGGLFIFPSTSPTDFDPHEARLSIDRIVSTGARSAYLTHFGEIHEMTEAARQLKEYLDFAEPLFDRMSSTVEGDRPVEELHAEREREIRDYLTARLRERGIGWSDGVAALLKMDIGLNAAGMVFAARKRRAGSKR